GGDFAMAKFVHGIMIADSAEGFLQFFAARDQGMVLFGMLCNPSGGSEEFSHIAQFLRLDADFMARAIIKVCQILAALHEPGQAFFELAASKARYGLSGGARELPQPAAILDPSDKIDEQSPAPFAAQTLHDSTPRLQATGLCAAGDFAYAGVAFAACSMVPETGEQNIEIT